MRRHQGPTAAHPMQCMEIWGGSQAVENAISTPGLDAWVYSQPFAGATNGGDVHYVSLCGGGVVTRMIVADVSGHGEEVAEFSRSLRSLMRKNINTKSQTALVGALNRQFSDLAQLRRFATAVVATYLASDDRLSICNAGHPRPLWYHAERREWSILSSQNTRAANLPLGFDSDTAYEQFVVELGRDDIVLFYTDALTEARNGSGSLLGEDGLLEIARGIDPANPMAFGPAILDAVGRYRGGEQADDDVTVLVIHHNAAPTPRLSVGQKLDVYAKFFGLKSV